MRIWKIFESLPGFINSTVKRKNRAKRKGTNRREILVFRKKEKRNVGAFESQSRAITSLKISFLEREMKRVPKYVKLGRFNFGLC